MEKYKIDDFVKLDISKYKNREMSFSIPQVRMRGKITGIHQTRSGIILGIFGKVKGKAFSGKMYDDRSEFLFSLYLTDLKKNYNYENIQIIIYDEASN